MEILWIALYVALSFLIGSIPFSLLLVRLVKHKDVRAYGDGNPGAYNAWMSGGWQVGIFAAALDVSKGFFPAYFAQAAGIESWSLLIIALAPILGHIFSPFLHRHGGKGIATSLGVWLALGGLPAIVAFALLTISSMLIIDDHAWNVMFGMVGLIAFSIFYHKALWFGVAVMINLVLLIYSHRRELSQPIAFRSRLRDAIVRRRNS
jgi:glycerol-3-phosphate acyltransferase PlsY